MKVERIQQSYAPAYGNPGYAKRFRDDFVRNTQSNVQFTGKNFFENAIIRFLKNKSYITSIKGSKRPYLSIDKDLENMVKQVEIPVSRTEQISAWDINPNNSKKYLIFLHGFSQNITNNQPLYKALKDSDFGILAIDYRSYGKNKNSKHINENDIMQDVKASVKYLKNKGVNNIGLIGHSFGSYISAKISNLNDFAFQILVSPMLSLEFWLKNVIKHPKKYKSESRMIKYIPEFGNQYSKIFDIKRHLADNQTQTYVIQAQRDRYVRTSKVTALLDKIANLKQYIVLPKGGHRMDDAKITAVKDIVDNL